MAYSAKMRAYDAGNGIWYRVARDVLHGDWFVVRLSIKRDGREMTNAYGGTYPTAADAYGAAAQLAAVEQAEHVEITRRRGENP